MVNINLFLLFSWKIARLHTWWLSGTSAGGAGGVCPHLQTPHHQPRSTHSQHPTWHTPPKIAPMPPAERQCPRLHWAVMCVCSIKLWSRLLGLELTPLWTAAAGSSRGQLQFYLCIWLKGLHHGHWEFLAPNRRRLELPLLQYQPLSRWGQFDSRSGRLEGQKLVTVTAIACLTISFWEWETETKTNAYLIDSWPKAGP